LPIIQAWRAWTPPLLPPPTGQAKKNEQQFIEQNISLTMSNKLCFAPFSARLVATSAVACFTERGHVSSLARQRQKRKENYENNVSTHRKQCVAEREMTR
jgi:hypothetical protein